MLMVIDIPVIRDLALTASIGVAVLIFTNLLLLPVLLSYTGVSATGGRSAACARSSEETRGRGLGKLWAFLDRFTTRNWAIGAIAVSLALAAAGFAVCPAAQDRRPRSRRAGAAAETRATTRTTPTSPRTTRCPPTSSR